ncbi:histone-lysine N-methyltransferase SETMAR [Trichonephila clavipes]|nr:histone-lysine N-methyltransferase SETMAR [Trichonephila clavipes]
MAFSVTVDGSEICMRCPSLFEDRFSLSPRHDTTDVVSYRVLKVEVNKEKNRLFLQFFFGEGENASQVAEIAHGVYGANTVIANYVQFWFHRFRSGIFDVKDAPRTGRTVVENVDKITGIIEVDRPLSSRIDHKTVLSHLRKVGFKKKLHVWVPHQLTQKNMMDRISICEVFAKRNEIKPFLKRIVTGDGKWVTYYNIVQNRSWSKCGEAAQTISPGPFEASYWPELVNRRGVVFHEDNAKPHTSVVTRQNFWELGWEVLMRPPYSPDLAPSDYHLFLALQNFLSDKKLGSREDCENRLLDVFANKRQDFYEKDIMKLPLKWQQIMQLNGAYVTQIGQLEVC